MVVISFYKHTLKIDRVHLKKLYLSFLVFEGGCHNNGQIPSNNSISDKSPTTKRNLSST